MGRADDALRRLLRQYKVEWRPETGDPFRSLVRTILSQNTNYRNEAMAYKRLEDAVGIAPENLAKASVGAISEAIRPAGMYNQRGKTLKAVASAVMDDYDGDISLILDKPYSEAREELMALPGVGQKTADVLLMFDAGMEIIPVDRHIFRITKRLRLVPEKAKYDAVRRVLELATPPGKHKDIHVLLIRFGREICRAQRPKCGECFLRDMCPYPDGKLALEDVEM